MEFYTVPTTPTWRAIFHAEFAVWTAKSYEELRPLSGVCACEDREGLGGPYHIEVQVLENLPDYVHVMINVYGPHGIAGPSIGTSFIRHADGRLDAEDVRAESN